jgi:hypothetical protein
MDHSKISELHETLMEIIKLKLIFQLVIRGVSVTQTVLQNLTTKPIFMAIPVLQPASLTTVLFPAKETYFEKSQAASTRRQEEEKHKQRVLRSFATSTEDLQGMNDHQKSCIPTIQ